MMCEPLFNMTASAAWDIAASVISAREAWPRLVRPSNTWVAQITGTCADSHSHNISSCTSDIRSKPHSTARSPRAIMTPQAGNFSASSNIAGRLENPLLVSIFNTTPISSRPSSCNLSCKAQTSSGQLAKDKPTRSACRAANSRSCRSLSLRAGRFKRVSGRLTPLLPRNFSTGFLVWVMRICNCFSSHFSMMPAMRPSSKNTGSPRRTSR